MNRIFWILILAIALLVGLYFIILTRGTREDRTPINIPEQEETEIDERNRNRDGEDGRDGQNGGSSMNIGVTATEFNLFPQNITLSSEGKVTIDFKNKGTMPHNLFIEGLNIGTKEVAPGGSETLEFTSDRKGTFQMICSIDDHREKGMKNTLKIE